MSLKGHKLLILGPWRVPPPTARIAEIQSRFPELKIEVCEKLGSDFFDKEKDQERSEFWKNVTILVTPGVLPSATEAPLLKYMQLWNAAVDPVIEHHVFHNDSITCCTASGVHGPPIAEWVVTTFLAFQYQIPTYLKQQKEEMWNRLGYVPNDSVGKRIGILGYGSIGRQTARVAKALGMDVYAYTLHPRLTVESRRDDSYTPTGLGDPDGTLPNQWFHGDSTHALHRFLDSGLDLLVVATPLTSKTRGLIAWPEFEVLGKKKTFVANISRGPVINTADLVRALNEEIISGAALDVTDPDPLPRGHPLWTAKNVIITPHISGSSSAYGSRVLDILELNLVRFCEGKQLLNAVNRDEGY